MIRLIILLVISTNLYSQEVILGGVDVGNGRTIDFQFEMKELFDTEDALLRYIDESKSKIKDGTYRDIAEIIKEFNCSNKLKFQNLEIKESYPFVNGTLLSKKYNGHIKVELNNCKSGN